MRKIHERLKTSAPKRRAGTGRTNPQEGIIDTMVRKRREAKVYEQIGRKTVEKRNRPQERTPMSGGARLNSHDVTPGRVNQTSRAQSIKSMKAEGLAAQPKPTAPTRPKRTGNNTAGPGIKRPPAGAGPGISRPVTSTVNNTTKKQTSRKPPSFGTNFGIREHVVDEGAYNAGVQGGSAMATVLGMSGPLKAVGRWISGKMGGKVLVGEVGEQAATAAVQNVARDVTSKAASSAPRANPFRGYNPSTTPSPTRQWMNESVAKLGKGGNKQNPFANFTPSANATAQTQRNAQSVANLANKHKFNQAAQRGGQRVTGSSTSYPGIARAKRLPEGTKSYPRPGSTIGRGGKIDKNTWW